MRNRVFAQNAPVVDNVATEDIDELYNQVETLKEQVAELTSLLTKAKADKDQNT
jgi:anion-transporting  ArsA/GET3 family ATPase